jgi:hypothetical protein
MVTRPSATALDAIRLDDDLLRVLSKLGQGVAGITIRAAAKSARTLR